jgi:hypothetical protein
MDIDFEDKPGFSFGRLVLNFLTTLVVLATLGAIAIFAIVFFNPYVPFNPFPPPTPGPTQPLPPTTPTAIATQPLETLAPSATLPSGPTATATVAPPTSTPQPLQPTATATQAPAYRLQPGSPTALQRWWPPYEQLCQWMGVGGHLFDQNLAPVLGVGVHLEGQLGAQHIVLDTLSGSASDILGGSGYLFDLANSPIASQETLWIQLIDLSNEQPLSEKVYLTTYSVCEKNLIMVNWQAAQ